MKKIYIPPILAVLCVVAVISIVYAAGDSGIAIVINYPGNSTYPSNITNISVIANGSVSNCLWDINGTNYSTWNSDYYAWQPDPFINASLTTGDGDTRNNIEVFNMNGTVYMFVGNKDNQNIAAWNWSGTAWQSDTFINTGLTGIGESKLTPSVFPINETWYMILGYDGGDFQGWNWSGSTWMDEGFTASSINEGMYDIGSDSSPEMFNISGTIYIISSSGTLNGPFIGYNDSGSVWYNDTSIVNGLPTTGKHKAPSMFNFNNSWYTILGCEDCGTLRGYKWTGSTWALDTDITRFLSVSYGSDTYLTPEVFNISDSIYMLMGNSVGAFVGFNYTSFGKETEQEAAIGANHLIVYCNDSFGNMVSDEVYFTVQEPDDAPPGITINSPSNVTYDNATIWFNVTGSEGLTTCLEDHNGTNYTMSNDSDTHFYLLNNSAISNGVYTAKFYCTDSSENMNGTESVVFTVNDNVPPKVTISSPINDTYTSHVVWFNVTLNEIGASCFEDHDGTNVSMNGAGLSWWRLNNTVSNGSYTAKFYCTDPAGNVNGTETQSFSVAAPDIIRVASNDTMSFVAPFNNLQDAIDVYLGALFNGSNTPNTSLVFSHDNIGSAADSNAMQYADGSTFVHGVIYQNFTLARGMVENFLQMATFCNATNVPPHWNESGGYLGTWTATACEHYSAKPPRLAMDVWEVYTIDSNETWLSDNYDILKSHFYWYINNRNITSGAGLSYHGNNVETACAGESNNDEPGDSSNWQRWNDGCLDKEAIDMNALLYYHALTMENIINATGTHTDDLALWKSWQGVFYDIVENRLYDESKSWWDDYDISLGGFNNYKTGYGVEPMYVGLVNNTSRIQNVVNVNLNTTAFNQVCGYPAISNDTQDKVLTRWNGGVWSSPYWDAIEGLNNYGYHDIISDYIYAYMNAWNETSTSPEAFNPHTCNAAGAAGQTTQTAAYIGTISQYLFGVTYDNRTENRLTIFPHIPIEWDNEAISAIIPVPGHTPVQINISAFNGSKVIELNSTSHFNVTVVVPLPFQNDTGDFYLTLYNDSGAFNVTASTIDLDHDGTDEAFMFNTTMSNIILGAYEGDLTPPEVTIQSPSNTTYTEGSSVWFNVTLNEAGSCTENHNGTNYTLSNDTETHFYRLNNTISGTSYTAHFYCSDVYGNANETQSIAFTVSDLTAPTITVNSPSNTTFDTDTIWFDVGLSEAGSVCLEDHDGTNHSMTKVSNTHFRRQQTSMSDGSYTVKFYCNDTFNNVGSKTRGFSIDTSSGDGGGGGGSESATIIAPTNTTYFTSNISFNVTASSAAANCTYNPNGTNLTMSNDSSTDWYAFYSVSEGAYSVSAYCYIDGVGYSDTEWYTYDIIGNNYLVINTFDEHTGAKLYPFNVTFISTSDTSKYSLEKHYSEYNTTNATVVAPLSLVNGHIDSYPGTSTSATEVALSGSNFGQANVSTSMVLGSNNTLCLTIEYFYAYGTMQNSNWTLYANDTNGDAVFGYSRNYNQSSSIPKNYSVSNDTTDCVDFNGLFDGMTDIDIIFDLSEDNATNPVVFKIQEFNHYYEILGTDEDDTGMQINTTYLTSGENTLNIYATNLSYYPRNYYLDIDNTTNISLNAYLISTSESAVQTTFLLTDVYGLEIPNVTLSVQKFISGSWVTVAQKETDSSGLAVFQLISGDEYRVTYTYDSKAYYYAFSAIADTITLTVDSSVSSNFTAIFDDIYLRVSPLTVSYNTSDSTENVNFNFTIISTNNTLTKYGMILACNDTIILYEKNVTGTPSGGSINYTYNVVNCGGNMTLHYYFTKSGYDEWTNSIFYQLIHQFGQGLSYAIQSATENVPVYVLQFISLIITIFVMGGLAIKNPELGGVAGLIVGGIFLWAGWFLWEIYIVVAIGIAVTIFIKRRLV